MRPTTVLACLLFLAAPLSARAAPPDVALTGTLRAAFLVTNPTQAVLDAASGEYRGVSADIAREIGRRSGVAVRILALAGPVAVVEAVQKGDADIGFVAPNPERMTVLYSQTYMLVQQSFLVRDGSPILSVEELDQPGQTIGANAGDSVALFLKTRFTRAALKESPDFTLKEAAAWLADGTVVAFGGNRQRLRTGTAGIPGLHLLPDNLYGVPQAIAVSVQRPEVLATIDRALDEMRASGFLQQAVSRSGVDGIEVAPPRP